MKANRRMLAVVLAAVWSGIGTLASGQDRSVMMVWELPDASLGWADSASAYIGASLRQEVTDFAVGISRKSLAEADRKGSDLVRQMINDVALASGMRCWASICGADVELAEAALARYLVSGLVIDFSAGACFPDVASIDRLRQVVDATARRREIDLTLGVRFGALDASALETAKGIVSGGRVGLVVAPSRTLAALGARRGVRLVADDQPTEAAAYRDWFRNGLDAGFAGFCFPRHREFPADRVPFLSTRRLTRAALAEYESIDLIPWPRKVAVGKGTYFGERCEFAVEPTVPPEGYRLSIDEKGVRVASSDAVGRFYAEQTLAQLKRPDGSYPFVEVEDAPTFRWRGVQMDESRHFFGKAVVKKLLDTMAQYKLNVFHWHLTDSEGWRLDIPGLPELVKYGAVRPSSDAFGTQVAVEDGRYRRTEDGDGVTYGPFFYTEADVKEILAYAAARHVEVVPEIDFPAHFAAALAAYPQFACDPAAAAARTPNCSTVGGANGEDVGEVMRRNCARNIMCVGNDEAVAFLEKVLGYVCRLFPASHVNIGGDECPRICWRTCEKCRRRMRENGLENVDELQPWLTRRLVRFIEARGKRAMGYDEMLVGDVPTSVVGWYWRPERWIGRAGMPEVRTMADWTARGYDMVNCDWDYTYFYCGQNLDEDPFMYGNNVAIGTRPFGGDSLSLEKAYSYDPARGVAAENRRHVLGGVCSNWAEYTWNRYDYEWKLWPRGLAFAEVLWCGRAKPGFDDFLRRAAVERRRLIRRGVNCAPLSD